MPKKISCSCGHEVNVLKTLGENQRLRCSECGRLIPVPRKTTKTKHTSEAGDDDWLIGLSEAESRGRVVAVQKWKCVKCGQIVTVSEDETPPDACAKCQAKLKPVEKATSAREDARTKRQAREQRKRARAGWEIVRRGLGVMYGSASIVFLLLLGALPVVVALFGLFIAAMLGPLVPISSLSFFVMTVLTMTRIYAEDYFWEMLAYVGMSILFIMYLAFYPWVAAPILGVASILALLAVVGAFVGFCMCCIVPNESGSRMWMAISTLSLLTAVAAVAGAEIMTANELSRGDLRNAMSHSWFLYLLSGAQIAGFVAHLSFAFFLRCVGEVFHEKHLPEVATKYIVFQVVTAAISMLGSAALFAERRPDPWLVAGVFLFNIIQSVITVGWFMYLTRSTADCIES